MGLQNFKLCQIFQKGPAIVAIMVSLQTRGAGPTIIFLKEYMLNWTDDWMIKD